jgi:hypothetical protein
MKLILDYLFFQVFWNKYYVNGIENFFESEKRSRINVLLITRDKGQIKIFRIFNDKISCRFSLSLSFVVLVNL